MGGLVRVLAAIIFIACATTAAFAHGTGRIFVSLEKGDAIVVLDRDFNIIKRIDTSFRPRDMHFDAAHDKLYVACGDDDAIDVIDVASMEVVDSIPTGASPELFAFSSDGKSLFVSNEDDSELQQIDIATGAPIGTVETGAEPEGVLVMPDGRSIYVTSEVADIVHVIDAQTDTVTDNITVGTRPRRFATPPGEIWVSNELSGDISVIDPATRKVTQVLSFIPPGFRKQDVTPVGMALTHDGKRVLVTLGHANHLAVVDAQSKSVASYILVGERPWSVAVTSDDRTAIVANGLSDDITIVDLAAMKPVKSIPVGRIPHTVLVDD